MYIKKLLYLSFVLLLLMLNGCKRDLKGDISLLQSKEIKLSVNSMAFHKMKKDTAGVLNSASGLKLVVYSDSTNCSSCEIKSLYEWDRIIGSFSSYKKKPEIYFIFSPSEKDLAGIEITLRTNHFDYPVYIDSAGVFARENPHLPQDRQMHTFLLDENNRVVLVGNPMKNKQIEDLLYKVLEEKLGKE